MPSSWFLCHNSQTMSHRIQFFSSSSFEPLQTDFLTLTFSQISFSLSPRSMFHLHFLQDPVFTFNFFQIQYSLSLSSRSSIHFHFLPDPVFTFTFFQIQYSLLLSSRSSFHFHFLPDPVFTFTFFQIQYSLSLSSRSTQTSTTPPWSMTLLC